MVTDTEARCRTAEMNLARQAVVISLMKRIFKIDVRDSP